MVDRKGNKRYITLIVKPTHQCNLNCPYCYDKVHKKDKSQMTFEMIEKILKIFGKGRIKEWIFHGGEPLLMGIDYYEKQFDIIRSFDDKIFITFQSNGTLINEDWIKFLLKQGLDQIGLSFDGLINDKTRKNTKRMLEVFDLLKKHGLKVGQIMLITKDNVNNLINEYLYFKKLGVTPQYNLIFQQTENNETYFIDGNEIQVGITKFFDYWIHEKDNPVRNQLIEDYLGRLLSEGRIFCNNIDCQGSWFQIYPDGNIYPCGRDWTDDMKYQNLHEIEKLEDIYLSPNFKNLFIETRKIMEHCKSCKWFYQCHSGCFQNQWEVDKFKSGRPEPNYCIQTRKIFEYLVNFLMNEFSYEELEKYNPLFVRYLMERGFRSTEILKDYLRIIDKGGD